MADSFLERMERSSHLAGANAAYIEAMYERYLDEPNEVAPEWREYFDTLPRVEGAVGSDVPHSTIVEQFERLGRNRLKARPERESHFAQNVHEQKQMRVQDLVSAYRHRGHKKASIDPLGMMERPTMPVLDLAYHHLSPADLDEAFHVGTFHYGAPEAKLRDLVDALEQTYCASIGFEYMHIVDQSEQLWVQQRLESVRARPTLTGDQKRVILERLTAAEGLEKYLHGRYPGTKRFGLEGGESLIPMLHELLQRLGSHGVLETVMAMAHRGRLNVLVNILGKDPWLLFDEFDGKLALNEDDMGDVKYHQGFSSNVMTPGGEMHLALAFNPSHLEIVGPVVEGSVRARQDRRRDYAGERVVPILVHGDAAFAGQGVVMETFQMSQTRGFKTGGTIHIIINNQIGFTTHRQDDARSTEYCSEVAKLVQAPIFHVNGDDPEAVLFVTQLAADYRMEFNKDVVIDLVCYRRRGHNEAEEPMKTQPLMYKKIRQHPTTRALYMERLRADGLIDESEADGLADTYRDTLDQGGHVALSLVNEPDTQLFVDWSPYLGHDTVMPADTRVDLGVIQALAKRLEELPDGFVLQRQVQKIMEDRHKMSFGAMPINWGFAETMAYATLLEEGYGVRLTGQDVGVGTFSHRHAALHNQKDGKRYIPLNGLSDSVNFDIYDSLLSEEAVLAFEYGYATTAPDKLVIWEAQFGDFANGAQVVIDQFISSGEVKWARLCGLTMLLPHGYEGAGPEHSSARLERFLQLCAQHNMQVCLPTTPAQVFHMLRRQLVWPARKPLVALTPKSLLRHKLAVSTLEDLADGTFHTVLGEVDEIDPEGVERVVLCSGKVYYDLLEARREADAGHVAIIRLEQLYPFPEAELERIMAPYGSAREVVWCQEEPMNQGAWYASQHHMRRVIMKHNENIYLAYAGRPAFAAPASGHAHLHSVRQQRLVQEALFG
ncbi:MAG: 2-oxoglutarate dehydrogenase E1 component [Pseudomonadales bacterium]|nr:2-oxoglutarate dehydrogenase E1 component [Pseudomonadales bacterium]NIX07668.1 2-oxoglutarate dehydrogenase E1 component [Pseudomonadales bacterium]